MMDSAPFSALDGGLPVIDKMQFSSFFTLHHDPTAIVETDSSSFATLLHALTDVEETDSFSSSTPHRGPAAPKETGFSSFPTITPVLSQQGFKPLTDTEINDFFEDLDENKDGFITFDEVQAKLKQVYGDLASEPRKHHLHHPERVRRDRGTPGETVDIEKGEKHEELEQDGLRAFLCSYLPVCTISLLPREEFVKHVRAWNIPSQHQSLHDELHKDGYESRLPILRRIRARWLVAGPQLLFLSFVITLQVTLGVFEFQKFARDQKALAAFGWGCVIAKTAAGALTPTLFFMILSMSRWFATACRKSYYLSKYVNWDLSQKFHIWMAVVALLLGSIHGMAHLTGSFIHGSQSAHRDSVAMLLGPHAPKSYAGWIRSVPGWSGVVIFGLFWIIALLSQQRVRRWSYEIFQLAHLLMLPLIGFLCFHGTAKLLQHPMLGFWLVLPTSLVIVERTHRLYRGFRLIPARMEILDDDTVSFTCTQPKGRNWSYEAGQFIFLRVPSVSFFQWHPFTISACNNDILQVHVKTDGNWTRRLRDLPTDHEIGVGIDGPFGAPAQRFYEFDRAIIIGAGVGITPFSAIMTDLLQKIGGGKDPWAVSSRHPNQRLPRSHNGMGSPSGSATTSQLHFEASSVRSVEQRSASAEEYLTRTGRRVDLHWLVRQKNNFLWFSDLLNRAHDFSHSLPRSLLALNIRTHITAKRKDISTHIFRYLLDSYRTPSTPYSALTGLKTKSEFGRPDFQHILREYHEDMKREGWMGGKVGVFFCGSHAIGMELADTCSVLTAMARADGSDIRYVFVMEVFG